MTPFARARFAEAVASPSAGSETEPRCAMASAVLCQSIGAAKAALKAYTSAAKLAPRWGLLHLKWGEALAAQGKAEEARAKWRAAAGMDLTAAERARLRAMIGKRTL